MQQSEDSNGIEMKAQNASVSRQGIGVNDPSNTKIVLNLILSLPSSGADHVSIFGKQAIGVKEI